MKLVLRLDLSYVPWNAQVHHEPAAFIRLLDVGRRHGLKYHFFVSTANVLAFPTMADQALNDGHDVDWLRFSERDELDRAEDAFQRLGHRVMGGAGTAPCLDERLQWWIPDATPEPSTTEILPFPLSGSCDDVRVLWSSPTILGAASVLETNWLNAIEESLQQQAELVTFRAIFTPAKP